LGFGIYDAAVIHRPVVLAVALAAVVAAVSVVAVEVRQEREFRRLIAVGDAALAQDQPFVAIEAFSGALAFKPASMLAHLKRGDAYRRRGEFTAALRDLDEAARLDETAPQPLELLGDVHAGVGHHEQAAEFYERYLQLDDRAARVLYKLALSYVRQEQPTNAVPPLTRAIALDDRFAEAHYLLGMSLRALRRHDEALPSLGRAIALDAAFIAAREERAALYAERGRTRESLEEIEAIAALEPGRPERLVSLALAYARLGRRDTAVATLRRAAERHPDAPTVYAALGRVWLDAAGSPPDAIAVANAVEALQPVAGRADATSEMLALYGRALLESGKPQDAERVLLQAVRRSPIEPLAYRYLAEAAQRLHHTPIARDAQSMYAALAAPQ
jgi:tetratricopeptide (TPR) repeat protein